MPAPDSICRLVETFNDHRDHYKSAAYNETELRREFLDPFFRTLGWDIDNTQGYADAYKDVIHEDAIKIGGSTKAPDYCFRIGGTRKFFLEAKRPVVNIKTEVAAAYQVRRYAWSANLPLSVLSNFEEFSIYDCRIRPRKNDTAAKARVSYFTFDQYEEHWDEIEAVFSREAILKGAFDKYAQNTMGHRGTTEVDQEFLLEIERWRSLLARGLAQRNEQLNVRDLNFSVQRTIDRIIFLRICEDRGLEDYGRLQKLIGTKASYQGLLTLFRQADDRYNSGLFHFAPEKNRVEVHDTLTPSLQLDDAVLDEIISHLYYPESPYEFSVLPASILGHVYEQFLGKTIRLTAGHQAKVEEKPEVRKAGGVYYTPKFIVDHMVQNTVGRLLNGKNLSDPRPIPVSQASTLRVLDPACGSGSFLIEAYQYILDWHRDQYTLDPQTGEFDEGKLRHHSAGRSPRIYQAPGGDYRLTTDERKRILLNNIYGVDIDSQAVEVTKLSLLLKVLEGETQQNLQRDFIAEGERILPDLGKNIRCGNSIIDHDFYDQQELPALDIDARLRINSFSWRTEFAHILEQGGFDCIIANPPYVDLKDRPPEETQYIFGKYECADNRINLFSTFFERSLGLLRADRGYLSMIVPTAVLAQSSYQTLRRFLLRHAALEELARLPNESFGRAAGEVKVDTVIISLSTPAKADYDFNIIAYRGYERINKIQPETAHVSGRQHVDALSRADAAVWSVGLTSDQSAILDHMDQVGRPLSEFVEICLGLTPYDKHRGHTEEQIQGKVFHASSQKSPTYRKLLKGNDVRRFAVSWNGEHWIDYGPWLGAAREQRFFTEPRILVKQIIDWSSLRIWAAYTDEELYNTQNAFNLLSNGTYDLRFILGVLNSRVFNFYHAKRFLDEFKMRFQKILIQDCKRIPIPHIDLQANTDAAAYNSVIDLVDRMINLNEMLSREANPTTISALNAQIEQTDRQIDRLVCQLYRLTEQQVQIVETA